MLIDNGYQTQRGYVVSLSGAECDRRNGRPVILIGRSPQGTAEHISRRGGVEVREVTSAEFVRQLRADVQDQCDCQRYLAVVHKARPDADD